MWAFNVYEVVFIFNRLYSHLVVSTAMHAESWMSRIADHTNVAELSVPGTHNSAACYKLSAPSVQCQGKSISHQLVNGVRYLDIKLSKNYMSRGENVNDLIVVHGKFPVKLSGPLKFQKVLCEIYSFLQKYPTETVFLSVKLENTMLNWNANTDEFAKILFEKYIGHNRNKWYLSSNLPTLNYARGKIILLRRFPVIPGGTYKKFGIPSMWKTSEYDDQRICVQDYNDVKSQDDITKKANLIKEMIFRASAYNSLRKNSVSSISSSSAAQTQSSSEQSSPASSVLDDQSEILALKEPKLFINFTTAANYLNRNLWPAKVDQAIRKFNLDQHFTNNCGVIIMDFADRNDWNLVNKLVDVNFT